MFTSCQFRMPQSSWFNSAPSGNLKRRSLLHTTLLLLIVQSYGAWRQVNGQYIPQRVTEVSCNDLFTLDRVSDFQKRYEATLRLKSNALLRGVEVDIRFDREVDLLVNYFGISSSPNNRNFRIVKEDHTHYPLTSLELKLEVTYSTVLQPWPEEVRLNGKIVCPIKRTNITNQTPVYRYPPTSWNLDLKTDQTSEVPKTLPVPKDGFPSPSRGQQSTGSAIPRYFSDNLENKFNSSCQAMNSNIVISPGRWDGILTLHTDVIVDRVRIEIVFDRPIYILGNYFGEVHAEDNIHFVIENGTFILAPDSEVKLNFFVKFNEIDRIPDVKEVNFNGKDVCRQRKRRVSIEPEAPARVFGSVPNVLTDRPFVDTTTNRSELEEEYDESKCATMYPSSESMVATRIIGGVSAKSGEIPWHVAIFHDDQYQCGGSIISQRSILTAAHCLTKENSNETLELDLLKVYIGMVDISLVDDYFYHAVSGLMIHRDYNAAQHTTDIGIVTLKRGIIFNNFIKPVCLYRNTTDISSFYSRYGKVAGWGLNRNGVVSNILNYLDMPVVSQKKCSQTNVQYNTVLAYGESFCAGHADGNSVCNGDSGGGLVFVENYRYYLRGIVSISAQKRNQLMCDPNRYSVFTDVSKFLKWIRTNIE